ncbi:hypothetical protein AMTRI_Chr13g91790 [Amborella trichopoda]
MTSIGSILAPKRLPWLASSRLPWIRWAHAQASKPPSPPTPPKPPQKPVEVSLHGLTWHDPYSWMSDLRDKVAMRHMDVCMEQEEKYTEAVMSDSSKLQRKLQTEMAGRMVADLSTPPVRWGPWLYYRRVEEGKQYPVLCRRLASLNEEFISNTDPAAGFDFIAGKRIEKKLLDYNQEAERFGGYAYEELSEISPDHKFIAYTMYDKDKDYFTLSVRDLNTGSLCSRPRADRVANLAWAMGGEALLYTVTNDFKRPYRIFCSILGSGKDDILVMEDSDETVYLNIRNTKDYRFVTVNVFSSTFSKVFLLNVAAPLAGMIQVWECEPHAHCIIEHHQGYLYLFTDAARDGQLDDSHYLLRCPVEASSSRTWEDVFLEESNMCVEDVDLCNTHMVLILREGRKLKLCSIALPLPHKVKAPHHIDALHPCYLPLPEHVCQISPGTNYDFYSSTMRFVVSSPVMPDAVVDYNLADGNWRIVQQQNVLLERTKTLYGKSSSSDIPVKKIAFSVIDSNTKVNTANGMWNDLSEYYACEYYDVSSEDVAIPLTVVYSRKKKIERETPGLLHGHGAYGELLDKRWRAELKSLLDRGWVVAFADVRGGGGGGRRWHHEGQCTKKQNGIHDYIACAKFLIDKELVHHNKLAAWGYSAGALLVAAAINICPDLFRAAILKVPFLDTCNTLIYPVLPLDPADYEEFGYPEKFEDFEAIRRYSPYDNIKKGVPYPAVLVSSSFNTRFGVWEAAKWVARVRELTIYDPARPVLLNLTTDIVEENRYMQSKEIALEMAFLIKMMHS